MEKREEEIVLGRYRDREGNYIERYMDDFGEYIESEEINQEDENYSDIKDIFNQRKTDIEEDEPENKYKEEVEKTKSDQEEKRKKSKGKRFK